MKLVSGWIIVVVGIYFMSESASVCSQTCISVSDLKFDEGDMCRFLPKHLDSHYIWMSDSPLTDNETLQHDLNRLVHDTRLQTEGLKLAPEACRKAALALTCPSSFLQCFTESIPAPESATSPIQVPIPIPRPPCHSACVKTVHDCKDFFHENGIELPDCGSVNNLTGLPNFPVSNWTYPVNITLGIYLDIPCFEVSVKDVPNEFECPTPLVFDHSKNPRCNIPCPNPLYTHDELKGLNITQAVIGTISLICAIIVANSYGLNPKARKWPGVCVFFFAMALVIFESSKIMFFESPDAQCRSITDDGDRGVSYCLANSFFHHVGGLGSAGWACVLALNLFLLISFNYKFEWPGIIIACTIATGYPLASWTAGVASNRITGNGFSCAVGDTTTNWVAVGLTHIPILFSLLVCGIIMIPCFYLIIKAKFDSKERVSRAKKWMSALRVLLYLLYFFIVLLIYEFTMLYSFSITDEANEGVTKWIKCNIALEHDCRERYLKRVPMGLLYVSVILQSFAGIILLFCFGFTSENLKWWKQVLQGRAHIFFAPTTSTSGVNLPGNPRNKSGTTPPLSNV